MSSLDNLLTEVGPILASSQFTHPSFREVLTARQFADEINSGLSNLKHIAHALWLYNSYGDKMADEENSSYMDDLPRASYYAPDGLEPKWRPVLTHLAGMLNEDKAKEFVDVVGGFHKSGIHSITHVHYYADQRRSVVLEDFALCASFIGRYQTSVDPDGNEKKIIDELLSVVEDYTDEQERAHVYRRAEIAANSLALTKSSYAARKLVNYVIWCENVPDLGYPIDDARMNSSSVAYETVIKLANSGIEVEGYLLNNLPNRSYWSHAGVLSLLGELGGLKSLETLICAMTDANLARDPHDDTDPWLSAIFELFRRHDFNPEQIKLFNEKISNIKDGNFMRIYHRTLENFAARMLEYRNITLYDHLERNKMQFWDYWMVYKPK